MSNRYVIIAILLVQAISAVVFVSEIVISVFGLPVAPVNWQLREIIELSAAVGLVAGTVFLALALRDARRRRAKAEKALRQARTAFHDLMDERFQDWALTPAERDVALFAIKGFSTQDMAGFRNVSEGTIKAQTAAIYRKAGVNGRPQLLSLFIDELVRDDD